MDKRNAILSAIWSNPLTNVKRHSDPWPTVTSQPIRLSTNSMTLIPSLTLTKLWVVSMEHLQRVWLASRERLPFRTPGSVPLFGTCLCCNCWDQIPRICNVFTRLFFWKPLVTFSVFFHLFKFQSTFKRNAASNMLNLMLPRVERIFIINFKLYCGYKYVRPCMINRIWGLKQLWLQVNGHGWLKYLSPAGFEPTLCTPRL